MIMLKYLYINGQQIAPLNENFTITYNNLGLVITNQGEVTQSEQPYTTPLPVVPTPESIPVSTNPLYPAKVIATGDLRLGRMPQTRPLLNKTTAVSIGFIAPAHYTQVSIAPGPGQLQGGAERLHWISESPGGQPISTETHNNRGRLMNDGDYISIKKGLDVTSFNMTPLKSDITKVYTQAGKQYYLNVVLIGENDRGDCFVNFY
jgi:hypothetical protein